MENAGRKALFSIGIFGCKAGYLMAKVSFGK